jgi:D-glucuronyl C5-epimerase C-terminus
MGGLRRIAPVIAGIALVAAGCGGDRAPAPHPADVLDTRTPSPWRAGAELDRVVRTRAAARAVARRRAALAALEGVHTVPAALRRAALTGAISLAAVARHRAAYAGARRAARLLDGSRGAEERAVLASVERLAADDRLIPSRFPAVFLNLRRNTRTWTLARFPSTGERRTFGSDPAVFQYVPGRGMQLHPLASWGRVNARLRLCLHARCPERRLRRRLDALARLGARRGGFVAWEYYYDYAQGTPPWMSGMAQATAVQALSRAARAFRAPRYARIARRALGAFETAPPTGVAVPSDGGRRFVMYSFAPTLRILNGELQAVNGLRDAAVLGHSVRALRLVRAGDRAARAALGGFDTGAWSLYSAAGAESPLSYHQLTTGILGELCRRTARAEYCRAQRRFARYEHEPPRIGIAPLSRLWARRAAPLRFTLSKGSDVRVRVFGPKGVVLARDLQLARGGHDLSWIPPSRGRFRLQVHARGPEGKLGRSDRTVRVALPKPRKRPRVKPERRGESDGPARAGLGERQHRH